MIPIDSRLREHVHLLGELLGSTMREQRGEEFLEKIERIRTGAKAARHGSDDGRQQLTDTLDQLPEEELLPVARGFNQFLNLANIADQYHLMRRRRSDEEPALEDQMLAAVLERVAGSRRARGSRCSRRDQLDRQARLGNPLGQDRNERAGWCQDSARARRRRCGAERSRREERRHDPALSAPRCNHVREHGAESRGIDRHG